MCKKWHIKEEKYLNCDKCRHGYVQPVKENWDVIALVEKYGWQVILRKDIDGYSIDTSNINNILIAENYQACEYSDMFHKLVLFGTTIINCANKINEKKLSKQKIRRK